MTKVKDSSELADSKLKDSSGNELSKIITNRKGNKRSATSNDRETVYESSDRPLIKELLKRNVPLEKDKIIEAIKQEFKDKPNGMMEYTIRFNLLILDRVFREMLLEENLTNDEFLIIYHQIPVFKQVVSEIAVCCPDILKCSKIKILLYDYKLSTDMCDTKVIIFLDADNDDTISFHYNSWYTLDKDAVTSELYASILDKTRNKTQLSVEEHGTLIEYFIKSNFLPKDYSRDRGLNQRYKNIKAALVSSLENECPSLIKDIWGVIFDYIPTNFVTNPSILEDSLRL